MRFPKKTKLTKEEDNYIKFAAYEALLELDEHSLPVLPRFSRIINSSIFILPMQLVAQKLGHDKDCFLEAGKGIAMYVSDTKHFIILYDEQLPASDIRWTIARLFYLVKCGELESQPDIFHYSDNMEYIERCDAFAYYFTCPDIILEECSISKASDIIDYCKIPFSYADTKSKSLESAANTKSLQLIGKILKKNFASYIIERTENQK